MSSKGQFDKNPPNPLSHTSFGSYPYKPLNGPPLIMHKQGVAKMSSGENTSLTSYILNLQVCLSVCLSVRAVSRHYPDLCFFVFLFFFLCKLNCSDLCFFFFDGFCFLGQLSRWGKNSAVASSSLSRLLLLLQSTRGCCCRWFLARFGSWGKPVISTTLPEADTQSSQGLRDQRKRGIASDFVCVWIHWQHSYLLQVRPKQRWIWLKSIRLLKHLLFLLLHSHHLAGLCPLKKIQRLKRLCRSSVIRVVIMEKLWYLRFCVSPALMVLSSVVCNQIIIIIGFEWSVCQQNESKSVKIWTKKK